MVFLEVVKILVLSFAGFALGEAPHITLYADLYEGGDILDASGPHHNLKDDDFNDQVESLCGQGLWFLYEDRDYHKSSKFVHQFVSANPSCENLDFQQRNKVSSFRYAGGSDMDDEVLMLYRYKRNTGSEHQVIGDEDNLGTFKNKASSFAVTGNSAWTVYEKKGFKGRSSCMVPHNQDGFFYGYWEADDLHIRNNKVSSARKGCFGLDNVFQFYPNHNITME